MAQLWALERLMAVADTGSITQAAHLLHSSQRLACTQSLAVPMPAPVIRDCHRRHPQVTISLGRSVVADQIFGLMEADGVDVLLLPGRWSSGTTPPCLTAQMAGLVSLTLLKTNAFGASRRWGRTARTAAADAADPLTSAWVWAQEAYRFFYAGDIAEAITAAQHARTLAGAAGGVGAVLAAALERRAHAATGDNDRTRRALGTAEDLLERLTPADTEPSAFGYDEAQLRFHCGNAYTHLGDTPPLGRRRTGPCSSTRTPSTSTAR
jgi:DNA-binding transcriptional LysR family regulator